MREFETGLERSRLDPTGLEESLHLFFGKPDGTSALANAVTGNASLLDEIVNRGGGDAQSLSKFIDFQHLHPRLRTIASQL
jgi:hypothetical protein